MKFLSVCSGIEAASVAWAPLGWKASGFSEIESFPCAVLKHHYPDVPNYGDMTLLPAKILAGEVEAPDILCGGTPCQAFSVAGLRQSLDDARGNLTLTFCEIADAIDTMRKQPSIVFWENVPGVLNTKDNAFGCFLGALAGEDDALIPPGGRWTNAGFIDGPQRAVAWRILDAQYFGVAQRRRRVFVIASARADFDPAAVLFEFESLRRDTPPSRKQGQEVAGTIAARFGISRNNHEECVVSETAKCLTRGVGQRYDPETESLIPYSLQGAGTTSKSANGSGWNEDISFTLNSTDVHGVAQPIPFGIAELPDIGHCLRSGASKVDKHESTTYVAQSMAVRRLTPIECERLQGFPDNYTNIPWRKAAESPDGPRYKALGNSWAVPVVRWIGERIERSLY